MSTISNAVQEMVNNLTSKMQSGTPLSGEEQLLISKAISALQDNETWEKAVVAVVEEHLDTATGALGSAVTQFNQDSVAGINALSNAEASLLAKAAQLDIAAQVPAALDSLSQAKHGLIGNLDLMVMEVGDGQVYEIEGYGDYVSLTNRIFSSDGTVHVHTVPRTWSAGTSDGDHNYYHNFYRKDAGADRLTGNFSRYQYCFASSDNWRSSWNHRDAYGPAMAVFPLANQAQDSIEFRELISDYSSSSYTAATYRGITFFYDSDAYGIDGHYHNAAVRDKYGRKAATLTDDYRYFSASETAFYDNTKNCLVVIQDGKVWELYSDGWYDPAIATFGDDQQAQTWVDAQEDMFLVAISSVSYPEAYAPMEWIGGADSNPIVESYANGANAYATMNANVNLLIQPYTGDSPTAQNRAGVWWVTTDAGVTNTTGSSGESTVWDVDQNFMWDVDTKTLIPLWVQEVYEVIPCSDSARYGGSTTAYFWRVVKKTTEVKRLDTGERVGHSQRLLGAKATTPDEGVTGTGFSCINPYDGVWYECCSVNNNSTPRTVDRRSLPWQEYLNVLKELNNE